MEDTLSVPQVPYFNNFKIIYKLFNIPSLNTFFTEIIFKVLIQHPSIGGY